MCLSCGHCASVTTVYVDVYNTERRVRTLGGFGVAERLGLSRFLHVYVDQRNAWPPVRSNAAPQLRALDGIRRPRDSEACQIAFCVLDLPLPSVWGSYMQLGNAVVIVSVGRLSRQGHCETCTRTIEQQIHQHVLVVAT